MIVINENQKEILMNIEMKKVPIKSLKIGDKYFKPTQTEFERLQTLPDGYTRILSKRKAVFAIGNGWTVDVIAHIFKGLK